MIDFIHFREGHSAGLIRHSRITALATALAFALEPMCTAASLSVNGASLTSFESPSAPQIWPVTTCDDDGAGSLRSVVANNMTQSGDIVDLSQLQCGSVTLTTGQIEVLQSDLTFQGPGSNRLAISGNGASRIFDHAAGSLSISGLTLAEGSYHTVGNASGGCVHSGGSIYFSDTVLVGCQVSSETGVASGGAVAANDITLVASRVTENQAVSSGGPAYGGGLWVSNDITAKYSTISANNAQPEPSSGGDGGGIFSDGDVLLDSSTVDHNHAHLCSAVRAANLATLYNSTISYNVANQCCAVTATGVSGKIKIFNSTVAFNHSEMAGGAAVYLKGNLVSSSVTLQSSILAKNTAGPDNLPADLYFTDAFLLGADNLVMGVNNPAPPGVITVTADPHLGSLQLNGGRTTTHALLLGSPAIGVGNNTASETYDQRGSGYPRASGPAAIVDMGAFQFDSIFAETFEY